MNVRKENVELAQELVNVRRNCTEKLTKIKVCILQGCILLTDI